MSSTLVRIIQRAAATTKPYNCQDAVLIIKALSALRLNRPEVRSVCEKACFSLASSPNEVAAPVVIDLVNRLSMLQSAQLQVVQEVLVKRFCELSLGASTVSSGSSSVDPRTAQKAALALCKLGRNSSSKIAVEHVLRLLHVLLRQHSRDTGLHLAYVALYSYSDRFTAQPLWWLTPQPHKPSIVTLTNSLRFLLEHPDVYRAASGNVAWQLLHVLLVLPPSSNASSKIDEILRQRIQDFEAHARSGAMTNAVSGGAYAAFLQTFCADVCKISPSRAFILLSGFIKSGEFKDAEYNYRPTAKALRPLNLYDATKLAGAVALTLSTLTSTFQYASSSTAIKYAATAYKAPVRSKRSDMQNVCIPSSGETQKVTDDSWKETARLCRFILDCIVQWEQERVLSAGATKPSNAAFSEEHLSPDCLLVASLLHAYAKSVRFQDTVSNTDQFLNLLFSLVPQLSDTVPTLLSWMLVSLAAITNCQGFHDVATLSTSSTFLLRQFLCFSSRKRNLRSDVEVLYGCVRMMVNTARDENDHARLHDGEKYDDFAATTDDVKVTEDGDMGELAMSSFSQSSEKKRAGKAAVSSLFRLCDLTPLLHDTALRLRSVAANNAASGVHRQDVDMCLTVLLGLYSLPGNARGGGSFDAAEEQLSTKILDAFQKAVLECLEKETEDSKVDADSFCLRAARLNLLSKLMASPATTHSDVAVRLRMIELTQMLHIQHSSTIELSSAGMLRCLAVLRDERYAAALSGDALCGVLCSKYQKYIDNCMRANPHDGRTLQEIIRVLWRARQAGVPLCFDDGSGDFAPDNRVETKVGANLVIPAQLCKSEHLTTHAAADLLKLLWSAPNKDTARGSQFSCVVHQVASTLVCRLQQTLNVSCLVRVLETAMLPSLSQLLFPREADLMNLFSCTSTHVSHLLERAETSKQRSPAAYTEVQQASRLLAAVAVSHPFYQVPFTSKNYDALKKDLLRLAVYVERNPQNADELFLLKIKLLCRGVV